MQSVSVGGLPVSRLCLGTMYFGSTVARETSYALLDGYAEAGGNFLDTANNYAYWVDGGSGDESETLVGRWLANRSARDHVVLATKVGARPRPGGTSLEDAQGLSARAVAEQVEGSLRRLGTDRIDLLYTHIHDPHTPVEETLRALTDLVQAGKVREIAASNLTRDQLAEAVDTSGKHGLATYRALPRTSPRRSCSTTRSGCTAPTTRSCRWRTPRCWAAPTPAPTGRCPASTRPTGRRTRSPRCARWARTWAPHRTRCSTPGCSPPASCRWWASPAPGSSPRRWPRTRSPCRRTPSPCWRRRARAEAFTPQPDRWPGGEPGRWRRWVTTTRVPRDGTSVMLRGRVPSGRRRAGRRSTRLSTTCSMVVASSMDRPAPRHRRMPPPNGIQVAGGGCPERKCSGWKSSGAAYTSGLRCTRPIAGNTTIPFGSR